MGKGYEVKPFCVDCKTTLPTGTAFIRCDQCLMVEIAKSFFIKESA